jgi:hypothetical protein
MTTFASPVTVGLPDAEHRIRLAVIDGPRAGLAAMTQHGLGGYRMADMVWQLAFKRLTRAILEPSPETLEEAREALELLARNAPCASNEPRRTRH